MGRTLKRRMFEGIRSIVKSRLKNNPICRKCASLEMCRIHNLNPPQTDLSQLLPKQSELPKEPEYLVSIDNKFENKQQNSSQKFNKSETVVEEKPRSSTLPNSFTVFPDYEVENGPEVFDKPWCRFETEYTYTVCMLQDLSNIEFVFQ